MEERASVSGCRFRRRSNVAERALSAVVKADRDDVVAAIVAIGEISQAAPIGTARRRGRRRASRSVDADHHVQVTPARNGLVVSYPLQPGVGTRAVGPWVAFVTLRQSGIAVTVSSRLVTCTVVDGVMCNDDEYRWYLDVLAAQLRAVDRRTARSAA